MRRLLIGAGALVLVALARRLRSVVGAGPEAGPAHGDHQGRRDARLASLASSNKEGAIPGSARTYYVMARLFGSHDPIQAGEFDIPRGMGGAAILDLLQHGKPLQRLITVTEGMPSIIVQEKLAANPILPGRCRRSRKARCCPTATAISAARARAALVAADAGGDDQGRSTSSGPKRSTDCPITTPGAGGDARLDRREGNRARRPSGR